MNNEASPGESVESLRALKRRIYLGALSTGLLAILVGWVLKVFTGVATSFEQILFPVLTALCLGLFIALWRMWVSLAWIEMSLFAVTALSLLGRFGEILFTPENPLDPNHLGAFTDLLYWFPVVYVLAFLMFESRRQLMVGSLVFFVASVLLGMTHSFREWLVDRNSTDLYLLARFYLANAGYIVLLIVSLRLNEQTIRVRSLGEAMRRLAHTDPLIQIANRRELEETIAREINRSLRHNQPLSLILFDLDHFKNVNDIFGHESGDYVLIETAHVGSPARQTTWVNQSFERVDPFTRPPRFAKPSALRLRLDPACRSARL